MGKALFLVIHGLAVVVTLACPFLGLAGLALTLDCDGQPKALTGFGWALMDLGIAGLGWT